MGTTSEGLYKALIDASDALAKEKAAIDAAVADIVPDLRRAIDTSDGPTAQTLAAALEHQQARIEKALDRARLVVRDLAELGRDQAFVAKHLTVVRTMARTVSTLRDALTRSSEEADSLIEQAEQARERSLKTVAHAQRGLAQLRLWLRNDLDQAKAALAQGEKVAEAAMRAVAGRDEAALAAQHKAFDALPIALTQLPDDNRRRVREWAARTIGKGLGAAVDDELRSEVRELLAKADELEQRWIDPYEKLRARVMAAVIPDIDAQKAARALEIADAAIARKLAAAIRDVPAKDLERALESFRRANKLPGTGKAMAAALRREKVLR